MPETFAQLDELLVTLGASGGTVMNSSIVDSGLSVSCDRKGQAAVRGALFQRQKTVPRTASCSGTSGKKLSRWQ